MSRPKPFPNELIMKNKKKRKNKKTNFTNSETTQDNTVNNKTKTTLCLALPGTHNRSLSSQPPKPLDLQNPNHNGNSFALAFSLNFNLLGDQFSGEGTDFPVFAFSSPICQVLLQLDPFLNELTSMFEKTTETGTVWVTLKRCMRILIYLYIQ